MKELFSSIRDIEGGEYLLLAALASVLAAVTSVFLTAFTIHRERRLTMKIADAMILRDRFIKTIILASLPENERDKMIEVLDSSFYKGSEGWANDYLAPAFGVANAKKIKELLLEIDLSK